MKKVLIPAVAVFAAAGCATASGGYKMSDRTAETLAKFTRTGEKQSCLSVSNIDSITPLDERYFLVRSGVNKYYLNEVSGRCSGAGYAGNRIQYTIHGGSQVCRNEIVTVVDNSSGITAGSCGFGDFERLEKKPDKKGETK